VTIKTLPQSACHLNFCLRHVAAPMCRDGSLQGKCAKQLAAALEYKLAELTSRCCLALTVCSLIDGAVDCAQGLDVTSLREIKVLRELKSPYVVSVLDIVPHKKKFTMVGRHCAAAHEALLPMACSEHATCARL
jgi:hypothetical protein